MSPAVPGPAPALDLDAVSDYVADTDDGLALDYGPVPDSDAARDYAEALDYAKALDYDAPPSPAEAARPAEAPSPAEAASPAEPPEPAAAWVSPAMYWRRRTVALAVGIAVLTFLAWAVSGMLHGSGGGQPAGHGGRSTAHQHAGGNRSARHTSPADTTSAGHAPTGMLTGVTDVLAMPGARQRDASAMPQRPHQPVTRARAHHSPARRAPAPHIPACGRGDVVLSLVTPRSWFQRGRWPLFGVDAVSTGTRPCRFNMGSRFATVVVSSGRARIWGSADCVPGAGSQPVVLSRGVPAVRWIYWNRATSIPGCRRPGLPVHQGAYTAIAFDGQLTSQVMVFLLGQPGSYLP